MKKKTGLWIILAAAAALFIFVIFFKGREDRAENDYISRAQAAKMLALLNHSAEECKASKAQDGITDVPADAWYAPYVNTVLADGLLFAEQDKFYPMKILTYKDALIIMQKLNISEDGLSFKIHKQKLDKWIEHSQWMEIYALCGAANSMELKNLLIFGTSATMADLKPWTCACDSGIYSFEGLSLDALIYHRVNAYVRDGEIAAVESVCDGEAELRNIWVLEGSETQIKAFCGGRTVDFKLKHPLAKNVEKVMGDIIFSKGAVKKINIKKTVIKGEILSVSENTVEIKGYGAVPMTEDFKVYQIFDGLSEADISSLTPGNRLTEFVLEGGAVCGAVIRGNEDTKTIRVVLSTDGFNGYNHSAVSISSDESFLMTAGGAVTRFEAGEIAEIAPGDARLSGDGIQFETESTAGKLQVLSMNRSYGHPSYRGRLKVSAGSNGIVIVNELLLEEYLYAVLPSEMPVAYGLEALKVQAVCARSFAYKSLGEGKYSEYGADVDDSTACQVYNNAGEDALAIQAVEDTRKQVLYSGSELVKAYFFSTSCGVTSDVRDVWLSSTAVSYLSPIRQTPEAGTPNLADETAFRQFIDDYSSADYFEKDVSWFRWEVHMPSANIKTNVADITSLEVAGRGSSGIVRTLIIHGANTSAKIQGEYEIRKALCTKGLTITCANGQTITNQTMLPSGYFYVEGDGNGGFIIKGGGFGHGVGMSQNGVAAMSARGMGYEDILGHFFTNTEVREYTGA